MKDLKSFTLHPQAGKIVDSWKKGKKSGKVSDAIVKYQKWKEWYISKDRQAVFAGEPIVGFENEDVKFYQMNNLLEKYNDKCIQVQELKEELVQYRQASKPKRSLISRLFSSNDE